MNALALPKIDLHLHIDGAVRTATMLDLAREQGHELPADTVAELEGLVRVSPQCRSLTEFLATFDVFYPLLKNPAALRRVSAELCEDLTADGVVYAELRFAPLLNIPDSSDLKRAERDMAAAVEAVLEGMAAGIARGGHRLQAGLILCCYRGFPVELSRLTVDIADRNLSAGVCGVDLAGDESRYPAADFRAVFDRAHERGLNITVHAAEGAGPESARDALDLLHARRLGHGIRIREDRALLERVVADETALEICLTSNLQTATVPDLAAHPFREYLEAGVRVTLNTDDPRVSGIRLSGEWELATGAFELTPAEQRRILANAAEAAFTRQEVRRALKARIDAYFEDGAPDA